MHGCQQCDTGKTSKIAAGPSPNFLNGGSPRTATTECNEQKVDALVTEDRQTTVRKITQFFIGHSDMQAMIKALRYQKVCCCWIA
jgi:hypothetical protein